MATFVAKTISRISWGMLLFMAWQFSAVCQEKPEAILKQATEETDKIYTEAYAKEVKSKALSLYPESNYQYMRESYFEGKFTKQKQKFLNDTLVKLYQKNGYILNMETGKWMYPSDEAVKIAEAQKQAKKQAEEEARKQAEEKKAKELALQAKTEKQAEQARKQEARRHAASSNSTSKAGEPKDLGGKEDMTDEEVDKYAKEKGYHISPDDAFEDALEFSKDQGALRNVNSKTMKKMKGNGPYTIYIVECDYVKRDGYVMLSRDWKLVNTTGNWDGAAALFTGKVYFYICEYQNALKIGGKVYSCYGCQNLDDK